MNGGNAMDGVNTPTGSDPQYDRLTQEVIQLLIIAAERLRQHFGACAAEFDLSAAQAKVLLEVQPGEAVPMRALAARLGYDASNLTGLVDRLEERGVLARCPHSADRRVKGLALTEDGQRLRATLWDRLIRNGGPVSALAAAQMQALRDLLRAAVGPEERPWIAPGTCTNG